MNRPRDPTGYYIVLISAHGLIRSHDLELGRDADTGGQIQYVVELARALAEQPEVERVDLLTRQVFDAKIADDYAQPEESLAANANIIRLPFGPRRYLRKEVLWNHLDYFADHALKHIRAVGRVPDVIHSHYADAGYVGARLAGLLEVPLFFTGHSLGRVKRERLLARGSKSQTIEKNYNISRRIEAEEEALSVATRVIASTRQEVEDQYGGYEYYQPQRMSVLPPGIDLERFHAPAEPWSSPPIARELARFLQAPERPMVLAMARPDERKNLATLVQAYGESEALQAAANLVVVAGNRDSIRDLERGARMVLVELMMLVDDYDLYGSVAYPKHHRAGDVPDLYQLAARTGGVFINPALTEPFGLTLIEAAASGVPMVAPEDGGPRDILANCDNGVLIDPLDTEAMAAALLEILGSRQRWRQFSQNGLEGVAQHYTWNGHARKYLDMLAATQRNQSNRVRERSARRQRLMFTDRMFISDIDHTLLGDADALQRLVALIRRHRKLAGFGVATGRHLESATRILEDWAVPMPDVLITSVGSEIYYGPNLTPDQAWARHIDHRWQPDKLRDLLARFRGLRLQECSEQRQFKISYYVDADAGFDLHQVNRELRHHDLQANVVYSHERYLDFLPVRASKGLALRYFADKWDIPLERVLVAGDSGNDAEMLRGRTLGVVVGNHHVELDGLENMDQVYFAAGHYAEGVLEGMDYYDFHGECRDPQVAAQARADTDAA